MEPELYHDQRCFKFKTVYKYYTPGMLKGYS
jgi:hypothetical protein